MLHKISRNFQTGGYTFPSREDYLAYYALQGGVTHLDHETVITIQRDWHTRGQNGCVFAMHAARRLSANEWRYEVHDWPGDAQRIQRSISLAVADPGNEILSLIFPAIDCELDVKVLTDIVLRAGCHQAKASGTQPGIIALRYPIGKAESWIIGFAPLSILPATRRAPFAELAIRTKPKSGFTHSELNNDPGQAHLADVNFKFGAEAATRLIQKSKTRTAKILGGPTARDEARGAKAKVTFGLSRDDGIQLQKGGAS
jgi:hypothetical protein